MSDSTRPDPVITSIVPRPDRHPASETSPLIGLVALIKECESIHDALTSARARTSRLVVALRRHRKRERLVNSTLESLKQLKLQEVGR